MMMMIQISLFNTLFFAQTGTAKPVKQVVRKFVGNNICSTLETTLEMEGWRKTGLDGIWLLRFSSQQWISLFNGTQAHLLSLTEM